MGAAYPHAELAVVVIEDDESVCHAIGSLLESVGLQTRTFGSVQQYLDARLDIACGCMILDVRLPGRSGLDFQSELARSSQRPPVILISGHADVPMSVQAMKAGAFDFLTKPVRPQELLETVQSAIQEARLRYREDENVARARSRFDSLSAREREIALMLVEGLLNKQIAWRVGLSEQTVKQHRGQIMRKTEAKSLIDLARLVDRLQPEAART